MVLEHTAVLLYWKRLWMYGFYSCNYESEADYDDDSCTYIGAAECDCAGNVLDECGVCGGGGIADGDL